MRSKNMGFETFEELYLEDLNFGNIYCKFIVGCKQDNYVLVNGYLF